jgi:hypothetical protein
MWDLLLSSQCPTLFFLFYNHHAITKHLTHPILNLNKHFIPKLTLLLLAVKINNITPSVALQQVTTLSIIYYPPLSYGVIYKKKKNYSV